MPSNDNKSGTVKPKKKLKKLLPRIGAAVVLVAVLVAMILPLYNPGSPMSSGKTVMTVNSHDISPEEFDYYLSNDIMQYVMNYGADTFADQAAFQDITNYVGEELTFYYTFLDWAEESGHGLTQEQKDEVRVRIETAKAEMGSDEAYEEYLSSIYATDEVLYESECMFECLNNYYDYLMDPAQSPYAATAESLIPSAEGFGIYGAKHILILFDEEKRTDEETKALAEDILRQLGEGADFDELMLQYTEDPGIEAYPNGYTFSEGEMVDEFYQATKELEIGEYSGLVEANYNYHGYHIIMRIEPDHDQALARLIETLYNTDIDTRVKEADVSRNKYFDQMTYSEFGISRDYPLTASSSDAGSDGDAAGDTDAESEDNGNE